MHHNFVRYIESAFSHLVSPAGHGREVDPCPIVLPLHSLPTRLRVMPRLLAEHLRYRGAGGDSRAGKRFRVSYGRKVTRVLSHGLPSQSLSHVCVRYTSKPLTCFGRLLGSGRILAETSPFFGVLAILPSKTAVYVLQGTAAEERSKCREHGSTKNAKRGTRIQTSMSLHQNQATCLTTLSELQTYTCLRARLPLKLAGL